MEIGPIEQIAGDAGRLRRDKVALLVSDQEASIDIDWIPLKQSSDHSWLRLTTVAEDTVSLNQSIGMMRAEFESIDVGTNTIKLTRHPFVQVANMALLVKSPRNS
jgi:hypothetical protein